LILGCTSLSCKHDLSCESSARTGELGIGADADPRYGDIARRGALVGDDGLEAAPLLLEGGEFLHGRAYGDRARRDDEVVEGLGILPMGLGVAEEHAAL